MRKLAIVITSYSGKLESQILDSNTFLLPLQLFLEEEQWLEGFYDKKTSLEIVEKFKIAKDYGTSLPPLGLIIEQMKELSSLYDDVIYLPINSQLSSTCNTLINFAKDYKNIHVFNNHLAGSAYFRVAEKIRKMYEIENASIAEICDFVNWFNNKSIGYILPKEMKTFIKSGRLKGIKKTLVTSINLSLMIEVTDTLKTAGIAKTKKSAIYKIITKIESFLQNNNLLKEEIEFSIIYAYDEPMRNMVIQQLNDCGYTVNYDEESSIATMFHTGYGAIYLGINPKIK